MKQRYRKVLGAVLIMASVLLVLDGCSTDRTSYPQATGSSASGVSVYGTVDTGVFHGNR